MYATFQPLSSPVTLEGIGMATIRVLLVDDERLVRQVLTRMLTAYPNMEVVGEAATGDEAVSSVERLQPHIVVMDIRMPRNGWGRRVSGDLTQISPRENHRLVRICRRLSCRCHG